MIIIIPFNHFFKRFEQKKKKNKNFCRINLPGKTINDLIKQKTIIIVYLPSTFSLNTSNTRSAQHKSITVIKFNQYHYRIIACWHTKVPTNASLMHLSLGVTIIIYKKILLSSKYLFVFHVFPHVTINKH